MVQVFGEGNFFLELQPSEQERYDYWLNDFTSNKRVKKIIKINDDNSEEIILEK